MTYPDLYVKKWKKILHSYGLLKTYTIIDPFYRRYVCSFALHTIITVNNVVYKYLKTRMNQKRGFYQLMISRILLTKKRWSMILLELSDTSSRYKHWRPKNNTHKCLQIKLYHIEQTLPKWVLSAFAEILWNDNSLIAWV